MKAKYRISDWFRRRTARTAKRGAETLGRTGIPTYRELAGELAQQKNWAVTNLQNRPIRDDAEQDQLEADAHEWEARIARQMDGYAEPSDIAGFVTLKTYHPKGLPPLVRGLQFSHDASLGLLAQRNAKFRNEVSEQLDRLEVIVRTLEQKDARTGTPKSKQNRLDRIYSWFLDHSVVGPVLVLVVILGSVIIFTGNVADSIRTIRSLFIADETAPGVPPISQSSQTTPLVAVPCKIIVVDAVFDVGPKSEPASRQDVEVRFDGFLITGAEASTEPFALVVADYGPGTYDMDLVMGLVMKFTGKVTLTDAAYYIFKPEVTVYEPFNTTEPIVLQPTTRREAGLLLARYRKDIPSCENRRVGLSW